MLPRITGRLVHLSLTSLLFLFVGLASGSGSSPEPLVIPRITEPPALEDFLEMRPSPKMEGRLARVEGFLQRRPLDPTN